MGFSRARDDLDENVGVLVAGPLHEVDSLMVPGSVDRPCGNCGLILCVSPGSIEILNRHEREGKDLAIRCLKCSVKVLKDRNSAPVLKMEPEHLKEYASHGVSPEMIDAAREIFLSMIKKQEES